jgi:predicted thioesterase
MDANGTPILLAFLGVAVGLIATYFLIKLAVKAALREHQDWLDERHAAAGTVHKPEA